MKTRFFSPRPQVMALCVLVVTLACLALTTSVFAAGPAPAQAAPSGPKIWLQDSRPVQVAHAGPAAASLGTGQPLSMVSADFDADGVQDLVVGYSTPSGGVLAIHRGNLDAFAPQSDASFQAVGRGEFPSPFLPDAQTFAVPVRPDFVAAGDFTGNGNTDLAVASRGGSALYILPGDGKGGFGSPQSVNVSGAITSMAAGELGASAPWESLLVGLSHSKTNSSLLVLGNAGQGLKSIASYTLSAPVSNILFGDFADGGQDAAFLTGGRVMILRSASMRLSAISLPVSASAMALGRFVFDRNAGSQIALLVPDGSVQIAARSDFDPRTLTPDDVQALLKSGPRGLGRQNRAAANQTVALDNWKIIESFSGVATVTPGQTPLFFRTRISSNGADDIMWLGASSTQMVVISHPDTPPGAVTFVPGEIAVKPYEGTAMAALPMRINIDARPGIVALHQGQTAPFLSMPLPDPTFTVNRTDDPTPISPIGNACNGAVNDCSLREAILKANATAGTDTVMVPAGTYKLTIAKVANDCTGNFGALSVNDSINIIGAGQNTTIIEAGGTAYNAGTPDGVDMVMNVNEDLATANCPITNASASLSNLTLQNGHNRGATGFDGDGGCMEFDTGSSGTASLTLSSVTLQNCDTPVGNGGGLAAFNFTNPGAGTVTITGSIIQGNQAVQPPTAGVAGGIWASVGSDPLNTPTHLELSSSQVLNNKAGVAGTGEGGAIWSRGVATPTQRTHIQSSTLSGNQAGGMGGGIYTETGILIDNGTVISNNSGGLSNLTNTREGGGIFISVAPNQTIDISKVTITGNSSTQFGGGISVGGAPNQNINVHFSRIEGNAAPTGSNLFAHASQVDALHPNVAVVAATNNWWGTNAPAGTINVEPNTVTPAATQANVTFDPFIVLTHSATPAKIQINGTTTLTGDMSNDNHGTAVGLANLNRIIGLPITFDTPTLGSIPDAQPEALNASAQATATFNAGGTGGRGSAHATVDQAVVSVDSNLIASATEAANTVTITSVGKHNFAAGETVVISGVGVGGYNGTFSILATPTPTTFTYNNPAAGLAASSGGLANVGIIILQPPTIAKSFSPTTVAINAPSTITFAIDNSVNVVPINASFVDTLPANLVVATTPNVVNGCGGTVTAPASATHIDFSNAALAVGTCTIKVDVQSAVDNVYSNSVQILSSDAGNGNTASTTPNLTVINPPTIAKAFGVATIPLNGTASLTFTISSTNVNLTLNGVAFTDNLPAGLVVASTPNLTNTCGGTATGVGGSSSVSLAGVSLAPGASCTVSVDVQGTTAGVKNNSVQATSTNAGAGNTSNASITVVAPPTINKAFNPTSIPLNGTSTVTFTINNPNTTAAADLTGVAFSDTLPLSGGPGSATLVISSTPNVSNTCGGTVTATAGTGVISLSGGSVAHNASCTLSVDVKGTVEGDANNTTGAITSTQGGTGTTSNTALLKVVAPPNISKAFGAASIPLNGTTTVTFTITNPASNTSAENGIAFSDTLTNGLQVASTPGVTNSCGGTVTATANSTSISLVGGSIATPGATCTIVVNVTGTQSGSNIPNTTGAVSSTNGGTGATSNTATITVASPPSVTKTFTPTKIPLNGTTLLTINISNPNSNVTLNGLAFTDNLPAGLVVASTPNLSNTCGGTATATAGASLVSLSGGTVAASASCAVSVNVQGTTAGDKINSVQVSSTEGGNSNTANATVTVVAPATISKAFGAGSIPLNGTTTVTFTISNPNNPGTPANGDLTGLAFSDTLPVSGGPGSATLVVAATPGVSNTCGGTVTATAGTGVISLSGGSVAHNTSCTLSVNVTGTVAGDANNTTGAISSTEGGTGTTSNTALIKVVAPPSVAKVFNPSTISLNATTSLTFTITNPAANTATALQVVLSDTLPTGLTVVNSSSTVCGGTLTTTAPTGIQLSAATIAVNSQCQFSVTVTGAVSGQYTNTTGPVASQNGGAGNTASANLTVASPPTIAKAFSPTTIPLNGISTITFTINNPNSNVTLNGVAFTDNLPAGVVVAPTPNVSNTCSGTVSATAGASALSLSSGVVNQGGSCTLSVDVQGTTAGTKLNTTGAITSTEGGTGTTSNTASLTVNQASTTTAVASSSNPSVFGVPVTFTATVSNASGTGAPTGSVQFVVDGVNFGSPVPLTGASSNSSTATSGATATLSVAGSPHTVTANYLNADGNFTNSTGSLAGGQTITLAITNTAVASSSNPSVFGQSVTFTATVVDVSAGSTAQPTGAVQFVVDGVNLGSPVPLTGASSNSSAATSQATTTLSIGGSPHTVTANYVNADGNFSNSTNSLSGGQVVTPAGATITVNSSQGTITLGDTVTFTATVTANPPASGTPTGTVIFFDGSTPIGGGKLSGGQTTFPTSLLAVGSHSITAIYNGDANFTASPLSSPITETVNLRGSTTGVALNPTTVGAGQASTETVTVTDAGASTPPGTPDVFTATGAPATGRTGFTATFIADGAVVITGGTDANGVVLNTAEVYSGGSFGPVPGQLNTARTGAVAVLLGNGKVLIAGGSSNGGANGALNSAELLDLNTGTFAPTSHNMTAARFGTTATLLNNGKVLIAGGANSGGVLNSAELYDPSSDTFTATGNLNAARSGASATLLGTGKVLVAGGSSNGTGTGALNSAELFDPAGNAGAGTFTSVAGANPTLATGRWQPEAALLLSGKVLVAGGQNSGGQLTTADLYDPAADSFTASAHQMNEARANGSAVALPSGMVLLAGGTTSQTVDLYDGDSDKFNTTGSLLHHNRGLVATLLNNGDVLVVGLNIDNDPTDVSDAELYSPSFNPLGTVGFGSSEPSDVFGAACVLTPSSSTASTCTSTVTPIQVATSPHTITATYPADAVHSGSSNSASLTVIPTAPPTIAKAFSAANVAQNSKVNVSFTIVNPNAAATLTGISFTDSLPAGLVVATPNNLNSNCGGTFTAVAGSSSLSLTGGTVGPPGPPPVLPRKRQTAPLGPIASGQCVITLDLLVTGTGTLNNTTGAISANESGPGNPSNTATLQVVLAPTVNKAFGAASIPLNGTTSLTFNIANPNTSIPLVGIALSDTLPSGLVVATPNGLTGTCVASSSITATAGSNSISLSALNLAATGSCSFSVNVKGTSGGTKNNTTGPITGTFDDGSGTFIPITGGTASASIAVVLPPSIAKAFNPAVIAPSGISTLIFTITNPDPNTVAEAGVAFTDALPANVVVATPNGATGNCNGGTLTAVAGSGSISLTGGTIPVASSCGVSVNVTSSVAGTYTNTTGAVTSTNGGTGNTASATLTVATASLSITKTHTGNFPRGSTGNNYTITVSSSATAGPTAGTVTVTDTLPNVNNTLVPTAMTGTGWTCNLGTLTCTRNDSLAPGASYPAITLTVTAPINIQANVTNSATVSGGGDPNSHTANDPTHIGPPIQIACGNNSATVTRGQSATFTCTLDSSTGLGMVTLSATGLPPGALGTFNPPSSSQLTGTVTLTITTSGPAASAAPMFRGGPTFALLFPALGLVGLVFAGTRGKKNRKTRLRWAMALSGLVLLLALAGCGGRPNFAGTPPGTYTITVTGSSGTTSGSAPLTLIVQ